MNEGPADRGAGDPTRAPGRARRRALRWAHARAALLAVALLVQGMAACPVQPLDRARFERPDRQRSIARWADLLRSVGLARSPDAFADDLVAWSGRVAGARALALRPFQPFFDLTRTDQRWGLFLDAHAFRYRMHVETQDASGAWSLRYRPLDPAARTLASQIEYRRVRASWNPRAQETRPPYKPFVTWLARELFAREPGVRAVRVRMERFFIALPGEPARPETTWHFEEVRQRPGAP